jgi:hypothetical protein
LVRASGIRAAAPVLSQPDLEAIGDDVAGDQAVTGRRRSLGQRVGHRRRADDQALAAAFGEHFDQQIADAAHPIVAAMGVGPGAGDRDHGAGPRGAIRIESSGAQLNAGFLPVVAAVLCHRYSLEPDVISSQYLKSS